MSATPQPLDALEESNSQFVHAWTALVAAYPDVIRQVLPGVRVVWANSQLPIYNAMFLASTVQDAADFDARLQGAVGFMKSQPRPGVLFLCEDWLPAEVRGDMVKQCANVGLQMAMPLTGMATSELASASATLPELEFRRISDAATREAVSDINCTAYGLPLEWGREAITQPAVWKHNTYGYVAYVDGNAVSTASTFSIDGRLYVGLVATLPEYQRRGYAGAVMRHSLEEAARSTGLRRTVLHATPAGAPVYRRLGYQPTAAFSGFVLAH